MDRIDLGWNATPRSRAVWRHAFALALACVAPVAWADAVPAADRAAPDSLRAAPVRPQGMPVAPGTRPDSARARQRFDDAARWSRVWDDPERIGWQEPQRVVDFLRTQPGMRLADIGAGSGFFNPYLARAVGPRGIVYAVDVEPNLVEFMRRRAARESTPNVTPVQAAPDDARLPGRVDRVLLVNTYPYLEARVAYFTRLRGLLDDRALVAIVDWQPGQLARGPAPERKIAPDEAIDEMRRAGYTLVDRDALEFQYLLLFRPTASPAPR